MSNPRYSPPPSGAAPKPKGILKNASNAPTSPGRGTEGPAAGSGEDEHNRLAWDEGNLTLHELQREQQDPRMKIDEPKTPFVRGASLGPMDDDTNFDLDSQGSGYFSTAAQPASSSSSSSSSTPSGSSIMAPARRSSAAEVLAANTKANASASASLGTSATAAPSAAVGLDSADLINSTTHGGTSSSRRGADSRSPSFTLPNSRRSSAAGERSREGVREEMRHRGSGEEAMNGVEGALDDEEQGLDPEAKAKQDAFARKRNAHYGNEAEAMKIAAALAAREDDEDEDGEEEEAKMQDV